MKGRQESRGRGMDLTGSDDTARGALVAEVVPASLAARAGLRPGDRVLTVNGRAPRDLIDYRYLAAAGQVTLAVAGGAGRVRRYRFHKHPDTDLGLGFTRDTFDLTRRCANRCLFCFVDQLPPGARPGLYLKDDDYRLSLLHGNFITLTNLSSGEMERIRRLHLSPLYISVHATEPGLRRLMMGNSRAGIVMEQLAAITAAGITVHAQVVLCPGLNDGPHLDRTLADLSSLWPGMASVGVVPVGLTAHREGLPRLGSYDAVTAARVVDQVHRHQAHWLRTLGSRFVYAGDEFYLLSGAKFPPAVAYEGLPQVENGIGLVRIFQDHWRRLLPYLPRRLGWGGPGRGRVLVVTGVLAAPLVARWVAAACRRVVGLAAATVPVVNHWFGPGVTVSGLLAGRDVLAALRPYRGAASVVVLPAHLLNWGSRDSEPIFLDGLALAEVEAGLGLPLRVVANTAAGLAEGLLGRSGRWERIGKQRHLGGC